jgi:uncharacterized membrane protein YphA (DoxX/SURF4 family)
MYKLVQALCKLVQAQRDRFSGPSGFLPFLYIDKLDKDCHQSICMNKISGIAILSGRLFFGISLIAFGVLQVIYADFESVILPYWPDWLPGRLAGVYIFSLALIISGIVLLLGKRVRSFSILLGGIFLLLFLVGHLPYHLANNLHNMGAWTNSLKTLTLSGGAFIVAASLPVQHYSSPEHVSSLSRWLEKCIPAGPVFMSVFMIFCGIEHFVYANFVATLVPSWIPGPVFWTYFAGVALIGAGVAIILRIKIRLVATLLGIMIFLWFLFLHIPRAIADPTGAKGNECVSVFEALCFSGFAFVLAAITSSGSRVYGDLQKD